MTLGVLVPLMLAFTAVVEVIMFTSWRNSGKISEAAYPIMIIAALAAPVLAYALINGLAPGTAAIELL